jgi:hypothetical protein
MTGHSARRQLIVWTLLASSILVPATAGAQGSTDAAAAQALFDEAKALVAQGRVAEACPKFEESQRLDPASGTLLNLADCYERSGRLASAWSRYLEAAAASRASGNTERETTARDRAAALVPRLSKLVIQVTDKDVPGLEITRDGQPVGRAQWGAAIPVDEGKHTIAAKAPGYSVWQTVAVVKEQQTVVTVSVPKLEEASSGPDPSPSTPGTDSGARRGFQLNTQRTFAIAAAGAGLAGVVVGAVFGLKSKSKHDDAEKYCDGNVCSDPRGVTASDDARAAGNVSTVAFAVGALGIAGGLTLWLTAPDPSSPKQARLGVSPGMVRLVGSF